MMTARPLYLMAGVRWSVRLDADIVLRIEAPGRAASFYPLPRLSRIHSDTQVNWATEAMLACLSAGIPIVFTDRHGQTLGWCFGPRRRETTLAELLREATRSPQWDLFWQSWLRQIRLREAKRLRRLLGLTNKAGIELWQTHIAACNILYQRWGKPPKPWIRAMQTTIRPLAARVCADLIGDPELLCYHKPGLNLPQTLSDLLIARIDEALYLEPPLLVGGEPASLMAARLLEQSGAHFYRACAQLLGDLEHQLRCWQP
ncbi:MAG: CRISPR-associated endonuclease Cas1 [Tepidimonas sp.]|uniref:CRISPR-associated endonuclease Cas1 n=1 Tax=Tepidimonas sp. TaxID=2002775 RepID=UPI00298F0715|nr:CRISPR-associated endonuclease Cas1 [Tepidimonas sp.]MDW8336740.1 CRISPR-associated endonuclease Cas1 [Tepidimonas sp.]